MVRLLPYVRGVGETSAVEALVAASRSLTEDEQDELCERLGDLRLRRRASADDELASFVKSIKRAADHQGCQPAELTVDHYRDAKRGGLDIEPLNRLLKRFGSWRQAREAVELAENQTLRAVEARLAKRQAKSKIWRYSTETLKTFFAEAVEHYGRVPMSSELDDYRERRLEIARAQGNDSLHLPQAGAYRRRWGSYEAACLGMGYTPDQVAERLEQGAGESSSGPGLGEA